VKTVLVDGIVAYDAGKALGLNVAAAAGTLAEAQRRMLKDAARHDYAQRGADAISPLSLPVLDGT
jgi:5-methylthioadenosine/S-adenosylhomocysteine deaminase